MNGVHLRDRAAFLADHGTLVLADLHVGRGEESSVQFPLGERDDLDARLDALLVHFAPDRVVFAGDVLHSFDGPTRRAVESLAGLVETCEAAGCEVVPVAGNHDLHLVDAWDGGGGDAGTVSGSETGAVRVVDAWRVGDTVVCHGHEIPDASAIAGPDASRDAAVQRVVVGHDHPTIEVEGQRHPCFLHGPAPDLAWLAPDAEVLLLPAFNRLAPGVDVGGMGTDDFDSPFVVDVGVLRPSVYDEASQEVLEFPPLGDLRSYLR